MPLGFPYLVQLPLFAAIFGGSGRVVLLAPWDGKGWELILFGMLYRYMINAGDAVNGAGTTTGAFSLPISTRRAEGRLLVTTRGCAAWALTFLFLHSKRALVSRRPAPILLTTAVAALGGVEGWDYFKND